MMTIYTRDQVSVSILEDGDIYLTLKVLYIHLMKRTVRHTPRLVHTDTNYAIIKEYNS